MATCGRCGGSTDPSASFCTHCGASLRAFAPTASGPLPAGPQASAGPQSSAATSSGAWPGVPRPAATLTGADVSAAAVSALAGLGATALLPLVAVVALLVEGVGINPVTGLFLLCALALGGGLDVSIGTGFGGAAASVSVMPLGATLLGVVGLAVMTSRRLRGVPTTTVWRRALLTGGFFVLGGLLFALIGRISLDPSSLAGSLARLVDAEVSGGASVGPTLVGTVLIAALTLAGTVAWRRPDALPPALRPWRDRLLGPLVGTAVAVLLAGVLVTVFVLLYGASNLATALDAAPDLGGSTTSGTAGSTGAGEVLGGLLGVAALAALAAPNVALLCATVGAGSPVTFVTESSTRSGTGETRTLFTDLATPAVVPVVLVLVALLLGATLSALLAPGPRQVLRRGAEFAVVLAVVGLVAAVITGVGAQGALGGLTASTGLHLHYLGAPLVMLGWGAVLGALGAVLAGTVPVAFRARIARTTDDLDTPPAGFPSPPPGRRGPPVLAALLVLAVLCLLSGGAAVATASFSGGPDPAPDPTPVPTTDPVPTTRTTTPSTPAPTPATPPSGTVGLGPLAASDPSAASVQAALGRYFDAVNAHDYDAWTTTVLPNLAVDQPRAEWEQGYRTTRDSSIVVQSIDRGGSVAVATVTYQSLQDPADAPPATPYACISWTTRLPVTLLGSGGLVGGAPKGSTRGTAC